MAKIYGLFGAMTGKLADTVMSVRNGEQIARKYQPVVFNPSTPAQVAQRAKLKLLSQLSAVAAPVIAIPREGAVSARNLFTKVNFPLTSFEDDEADITLANVQLTKSVVAMSQVAAARGNDGIDVNVAGGTRNIDRVVYAAFIKQVDGKLRLFASTVVDAPGAAYSWPGSLPATSAALVVYAYGMKDNTENARALFGNLDAPVAESIAKIVTSRMVSSNDVTFTETTGVELPANREVTENVTKKK